MSFWLTLFDNVFAKTMQGEDIDLAGLDALVRGAAAPTKEQLGLLKLARFGGQRNASGSLRHDANVVSVSGIEGDHDAATMPLAEAATRLDGAGIAYIGYTTASHTPAAPRWRVICPFGQERAPGERAIMTNRLNGLLGGVLTRESWTLSQSFFYGQVDGAAPVEIMVGDHEMCIDEDDDLDSIAQPFRPAPGSTGPGLGGAPDFDALDEGALLGLIHSGQYYFRPATRLLKLWAQQGIAEADAVLNLEAAFDMVAAGNRGTKWRKGRASIGKWAKKAYAHAQQRRDGTLKKLVSYFENTAPWPGMIRLNKFTDTIMTGEPFPPKPGQLAPAAAVLGNGLRPLNDPLDVLETIMIVQDQPGFGQVGKNLIRDALVVVAGHNAYHPPTSWLSALRWDGKERINRLFIEYFPGELPPEAGDQRDALVSYYEKTAECFMVGAVARVFEPGCKLDTLPVLVGDQGYLKSRGIAALVPDPAWFSDDVSTSLIDRDCKESLIGKWILELAEFPHIRREIEKTKAWFSRQTDRFRKAYDRANRDWPRQCAFIASTNELEFIDTTGNRRFWPIPLAKPAQAEKIAGGRDQLWAEAVHWYRQGFEWWLSPGLETIAAAVQAGFLEDDLWDGEIIDWIALRALRDRNKQLLPFTTRDVLAGLGYALAPREDDKAVVASKADHMRMAGCLRRLGCRRDQHPRMIHGRRERFWTRPEPPE